MRNKVLQYSWSFGAMLCALIFMGGLYLLLANSFMPEALLSEETAVGMVNCIIGFYGLAGTFLHVMAFRQNLRSGTKVWLKMIIAAGLTVFMFVSLLCLFWLIIY